MAQLSEIAEKHWDAIIIGTGMGGATLGYALARAGWQVLFCEKGKSHLDDSQALRGDYAERYFPLPNAPQPEHRDILSRAGRYHDIIEDHSLSKSRTFIPFIGSGTGGSSALYGMALERFFPSDFRPRRNYPDANDSTLPEQWPISYEELAPYYEAAEKLYRVRGTNDPLRNEETQKHFLKPPPLTPQGNELFEFFREKGLHPYRLPMACEFVPDCQSCQGYLCSKNCKNDASRVCLTPAITEYGAELLSECEVIRMISSHNEITGVVCHVKGKEITLTGKTVVLAAGALESPTILLRSVSEQWPHGLGNESGLVGRNLMRHHIDLYAITPKTQRGMDNRKKEFALNDFYHIDGKKHGSLQSFGRLPDAPILAEAMEADLRQSASPWLAPIFKLAKPVIKPFLNRVVTKHMVLAATLEDLPYIDNRVVPHSSGQGGPIVMNYQTRPQDMERIDAFRRHITHALKPYSVMLIKQADNNQRIAHVCGTCRFGNDQKESVLDQNNRAHGVTNLYIVDSSFFPSSGGTNPSLTIAANALRVADYLTNNTARTALDPETNT